MISKFIAWFKSLFVKAPAEIPAPVAVQPIEQTPISAPELSEVQPLYEAVRILPNPVSPADYLAKYNVAQIHKDKLAEVTARATLLKKYRTSRYEPVAAKIGCPWWVVAVIQNEEDGDDVGRFKSCLHNGQEIIGTGRKTTLAPAGRGPFATWEAAAIDAFKDYSNKDWSIGGALKFFEEYNGTGYRNRGLPSPYDWAMTDQYVKGHYQEAIGADGKPHSTFYPNQVSQNFGCAAIMKALGV